MKNFTLKSTNLLSVLLIALGFSLFSVSKSYGQYCPATHGSACSGTSNLNDVSISGTTLSNLGTGCTSLTSQAYSIYAPGPNTTATLIIGQTYTFNVTTNGSLSISLWIDFDHNNTFDASEWTQIAASSTSGVTATASITIPVGAAPGLTGMRVRTRAVGSPNGAVDACTQFFSGESEDYSITIDPGVPCSGAPTAGTVAANDTSICPSIPFNLSLVGSTIASGLTYQWESSTNNTTWTTIPGATFISYQATQTSNTYYRCTVTCNGQSATSSSLYVTTNTFTFCYCSSGATSTADDDIGNVTFGSLNNGIGTPATQNPASTNTYSNFTSLPPQTYLQGVTYPISITQINLAGSYAARIAVFIDYDQNGVFDTTSEKAFSGATNTSAGGNVISGNVTIPLSSLPGLTAMRVILIEGAGGVVLPCGTYTWGETEDYIVNIQAATPCIAPPTAGTAISSVSSVCPSINFNLNLIGSSIASGLTYQWQSSPNGTNWTNISGATSINYTTSQNTNTYYQCIVTCNGVSATSGSVLVTVNSFATCYCTSGATSTVDDDIGNVTFGSLNNGIGIPATQNPTSTNTYSNFTNLPPQTYLQGISYPISITQINSGGFYACRIAAFIDYDQNGVFDTTTEKIFTGVTNVNAGGNTITGNVTIPLTSTAGVTAMRVLLIEGTTNIMEPCGTYTWGETEDYLVNIQAAVPCTAPPAAGMAYATDSTVCPATNFSLNLMGSSIAGGLSYQWQSSPNGTTWSNITGATAINYQTSQTSDNYYRCIVSCAGTPDTSSVVFVSTNSFFSCYCASNATDPADSDIGNVSIGSLNNGNASPSSNNPAANQTYSNFTSVAPPVLLIGLTYPISVSQINQASFLASNVKAYIDFNQDGIYDPLTEEVLSGQTNTNLGGNTVSNSIQIPAFASVGTTGMRVVLVEGTFTTVSPCGTYFNGETEDYIVNIQLPQQCTTPPVAGNAVSSAPSVCPNVPFDLNLTGSANAAGLTYQWQDSPNNTTWTNIAGATSILYTNVQTNNTYYRCLVTCSGVSSPSASVYVATNSFFNCYCTSGATSTVDDDLGNVTFGLMSNGVASPLTQNASSVNTYSNFTNLPPFTYIQTFNYPMSMTQINSGNFYACSGAAFIDFDHDGIFDPSTEMVLNGTTAAGNNTISGSVNIPLTAQTGLTALRFVLKEGTTPAAQPCGTYTWGETEDYLINIISPNSCTIPFIAGVARTTSNSVCASDIFTLSLDSLPPDTGFTFQWQKSPDNINWSNISGASIQIYNGSQSFDSWYRCTVTCNGGTSVNSVPVKIENKAVTACDYCNQIIGGNCSTNYYLDSIAIGGTTFNSDSLGQGCGSNAGFAYSKYPATGNTTADLGRGNYYDIFVKTAGSCNISVWLDYDQSGTFDASEWIQVSQSTDSAVTTTVPLVIPNTAKLGTTGMRIRSRKAGNTNLGSNSCTTYGSGETEDYYVTIINAISTGSELTNDKNVRIYPNPTTGLVTLDYRTNESKTLSVRLMNAGGQLIFEDNENNFKGFYSRKMDLKNYPKGIYYVQFVSDKNIVTKKICLN